jgi:hypothetical protein
MQRAPDFDVTRFAVTDTLQLYHDIGSIRASLAHPSYEPWDEDEYEQSNRLLVKLEHATWSALPSDKQPDREFPEMAELMMDAFDPVQIVFKQLGAFRRQDRCSGPECLQTGASHPEGLKVCQRCNVLRYCSRNCQRRHWNWEKGSHKSSCAQIKRMMVLFKQVHDDSISSIDLFRELLDSEGYSRDDLFEVVEPLEALQEAREELEAARISRLTIND